MLVSIGARINDPQRMLAAHVDQFVVREGGAAIALDLAERIQNPGNCLINSTDDQ